MIKGTLERLYDYDVPYSCKIDDHTDKIVIAVSGFGGSKDSPGMTRIMEELYEGGMGVITLDLPGHGENQENGEYLRIYNCITDLYDIETYVRERYPQAEICYYSISFGAYITMLYLAGHKNDGARVFVCSGAVNMPELYLDLSDEQQQLLEAQGFFWIDDGDNPLPITEEFLGDFRDNDLTEKFSDADLENVEMRMIHGDEDEEVDYDKAAAFAEKFGIDMITIPGGDHRMTVPGAMETAMEEALRFFND